jgi:anaerobic magnesium-protoporphyrin IX monomethyl ester cyclase
MKVTFVYPDIVPHRLDWSGYFYIGIGSLSATLKQEGHHTSLIHITQPITQSEFVKRIERENPDLIGFSSTSNKFPMVRELVSWLVEAKVNLPTICGGIHPTVAPDDTIKTEGITMICRGEGEAPLAELCQRMENKEDISNIANLWIKTKERIIQNPLRPLLNNLDELPFPDRSLFSYPDLYQEREGGGSFVVSRGCPHVCTYCCNHLLRKIYRAQGKPVRFRSVDNVIREIKEVISRYSFIHTLIFDDDILFMNRKWSEEFSEKYRREINLPFVCNSRADVFDESMVQLLKKAGCNHVKFGLENGNEDIRDKVLRRHMSNEQIKNSFALCKKEGLITESFNMVGVPNETPGTVLDTIKLNAVIGVRRMHVSIFQPFPGTELAEFCQKENLLKSKFNDTEPDLYCPSILELSTISSSQILMFRDYFKALVRYYQVIMKLPGSISRIAVKLSDEVLCFPSISGVANVIYIPLNYLYRRMQVLKTNARVRIMRERNEPYEPHNHQARGVR